MRIFKNAWFERFARKNKISDQSLREIVKQADNGLISANLGNGVIKQRLPRVGRLSHNHFLSRRYEGIFRICICKK